MITAGGNGWQNQYPGFKGVKEELEEAGVDYVNESLVVDGHIITSRMPDDLYDFSKTIHEKIMEQFTET